MKKNHGFSRLPGFRDFTPGDLALRSHIFEAWRRASRRHGFLEYDGPPLEPLDLYVEKSGEEIVGQLYHFLDRGDRAVALRPEMTPSLARILAERSRAMPKPVRWFSIPQLFRYERQQRGRLREHFQWNADIVGEGGVGADAEVLAVALAGLRELGLTSKEIRARISDRRLLAALLTSLGVATDRLHAVFGIIDRLEREGPDKILKRLREEAALSKEVARGVLSIFDSRTLEAIEEDFGEDEGVAAVLAGLREYWERLRALGFGDYLDFDLAIVRGLAYYTGIVFEIFDRRGELRAICGGGRYDRLLELVGGEPLPAVGFGMGDVVLGELLRERGLVPHFSRSVDYFLISITADQRPLALDIARAQRERGRSVLYSIGEQSVRKQFSNAGTEGAREVIILGPDEVARGVARLREMESGEEREVPIQELR